jgi:hypothetical protein
MFSAVSGARPRPYQASSLSPLLPPFYCFIFCFFHQVYECVLEGRPLPTVYTLDVEFAPLILSKAAHVGLPPKWIDRLAAHDPERRQVRSRVLSSRL